MSVYHRMLGKSLPCNVLELLGIQPLPLPAPDHESLLHDASRAYPDVYYRLGLSHLSRQELGLARMRLTDAVRMKSAFPKARLALAAVCDVLAVHEEAVEHLDVVLNGREPAGVARYTLQCAAGFCLERCGKWEQAVQRYCDALNHDTGGDLFADYRLAAIYLAHNELDKAVQHHRNVLEQQPQEQAVRISLAHLLQLLGRHQEAVWEYEKASCLEPDSWELQLDLAEELALMGDTDQAIGHLHRLIERQPQFPDLRLRLANLYSDRGDDDSAAVEYASALALHPDYLDCHIALARHELRMGRSHSAMEHFQKAISINDQHVEAYVGLAVALHHAGQTQRAQEILHSAGKIVGNSEAMLVQLGSLELQAEAAEAAEAAFDPDQQPVQTAEREVQREWLEEQAGRYAKIVEEHPTWADLRVRYGMLLKFLGRYDQAAGQFEQAAKETPGYIEAWVQLGMTRQEAGDMQGAMHAFETAVQIRPEWADLHYKLGLIYCGQMEFDLAMEQLELATAQNGGNQDFQRQLWVALQGMQLQGRKQPFDMADRILPLATEQK